MAAIFDEHQQYYDTAGRLLVGGFVYIGEQNQDPEANPVTIYSDRELTTPILNPQPIGADGRTENKIWVDGKYSKKVTDSDGAQQYIELDNGQDSAIGIIALGDVQGADNVTAVASPVITDYIDKAIYIWVSVQANAGPMTFDGGPGPVPFKKNKDQDIVKGEVNADQVVMMTYNETEGVMEWANQNNKVLDFYKGPDIASAATIDPWSTEGNSSTITGTTQITAFADAPNVGARVFLLFLDQVEIVESLNLILNGGNYTTRPGDILTVYAEAVDTFRVTGLVPSVVPSMQVFDTPGASTWNKPDGCNKIKVTVIGAGGGGGGSAINDRAAEGGYGGGTSIKYIDVSAISSETVTIGAGGNGGASGSNSGSPGGASSFGTHCSATGGSGGNYAGQNPTGSPGSGSGGDINLTGGYPAVSSEGVGELSGGGAPSFMGAQGRMHRGGGSSSFSTAGLNYGGGGGGGGQGPGADAGKDGAGGLVFVEEYY